MAKGEGIGSSSDTPKIGGRFSSSRLETSQGLPLGKELLIGLAFRVIINCMGLCETEHMPVGKFGLRIRLKPGKFTKCTHQDDLLNSLKLSI